MVESVTGIDDVFTVAAPKVEPATTKTKQAETKVETKVEAKESAQAEVKPDAKVETKTETAPVIDESKIFSELREGWKSKDDVKATLNEYEQLKGLQEEFGKYKESTKGLIKAANPFVEKVNEIVSKNPSQLGTFLKVSAIGDVDKLSSEQAVKLQMEWNGLTKEQADFKANRKYILSQTEEKYVATAVAAGKDEAEAKEEFRALKTDAQIDLDIDAKAAKEFLKKEQMNASVVPDVQAEYNAREAQRIEKWTPEIPKIVDEVKTIGRQVKFKNLTGEEKTVDISYEVSAEERKEIKKNIEGMIKVLPEMAYSKEGIETVKAIAMERARVASEDKRIDAIINQVIAARDDEWKARTTGKKSTGEQVNTNGKPKDAYDQLLDPKYKFA